MTGIIVLASLCAGPDYLFDLPDETAYYQVALEDHSRPDITAVTKYLAPAADDPALLATVYQNVAVYPFHIDFMAAEFPEIFPGLTPSEYHLLVEVRASRRYFAGALYRILALDGAVVYGFDLYTDPSSLLELPYPHEVDWVYRKVRATCAAGQVAYAPTRAEAMARAREWQDAPFPIYLPASGIVGDYRAYVTGTGYGRLRIFTLDELAAQEAAGGLTYQDVVVVQTAPGDLASPVACVVTGTPQTELSHLSLRLSQRGTPNAYDARAAEELDPYRDMLVRIDVGTTAIAVRTCDIAEAEGWWATHRPRLPRVPAFDLAETAIKSLAEIAPDPDAASRYGAKARGMALLRQALPEDTVDGFAVPFFWYERFMRESILVDPRTGMLATYAEYIASLLADPAFRTDPVLRTTLLNAFVATAEANGTVPEELVDLLAARIEAVWGSPEVEVRFRSSSNLEDIVPFNGAGLYRSTSACVADTLDGDALGPSRCDPSQDDERTIERALKRVWSSLWLPRAFSEREYWQVPDGIANMGVLVTPAFSGEAANGVIMTGNPSLPGDNRYVVNALPGELDVVDPPDGVLPEKLLLTLAGGVVTEIVRARASTVMPPGVWVLSDDEARRIGELAYQAAAKLGPIFSAGGGDILIDIEFKVTATDPRNVVLKQARPFLRRGPEDDDALALVVPPGTRACGVFQDNRSLPEEWALLSCATFIPGRLELPARAGTHTADLFSELLVGPAQERAVPVAPGVFTCETIVSGTRTYYTYRYGQKFAAGGKPLQVNLEYLSFWRDASGQEMAEIVVDEFFLCFRLFMHGFWGDPAQPDLIRYASCTYELLPLFQIEVEAKSGERASLRIRFEPPMAGSGPANLVRAALTLGAETRETADYWRLVYSADHHNWNERFWIFLDPPVGEAHAVEIRAGQLWEEPPLPPEFTLLDGHMKPIASLDVALYEKTRIPDLESPEFRRGDANADGKTDIADAVAVLNRLFGGAPDLPCADAADANDDGRVDLSDAIRILLRLFHKDQLKWQFPWPGDWRCGHDPTEDDLPPCTYDLGTCF